MNRLDIAYRTIPCQGFDVNGDGVFVLDDGVRALLCVIDSLGHGPRAAAVTEIAMEFFATVGIDTPVRDVAHALDRALRGSRGAQGMLCRVDGAQLEGCGIGNVEMRTRGTRVPVMLTPGILGTGLRACRVFESELRIGDRLVMYSDGVRLRSPLGDVAHLSPGDACDHLLDLHRRSHDDATILIADVVEAADASAARSDS